MERLVVFPGLSSPNFDKYIPTYDLLREECELRNIELTIILYPGQVSEDGNYEGKLSPDNAINRAIRILAEIEKTRCSYRTLGISFGCVVSLTAALRSPSSKYWERGIIWGPVANWKDWSVFGQGISDKSLGKGTKFIDSPIEFYRQLLPNEYLLTQVELPVTVGVGELDKYAEAEYLYYLQKLCNDQAKFQNNFAYIHGCSHNPNKDDPNYKDYINLIFS